MADPNGDTMSMSQYATIKITTPVSITAPAVRMVVVDVCYLQNEDRFVADIKPVVGLVLANVHQYDRRCASDVEAQNWRWNRYRRHADALEAGFKYDASEATVSALIVDDEYGLVAYDERVVATNAESRLFTCPWPQDEDEKRLAEDIGYMKADVKVKVAQHQARRAANATPTEAAV